MAKNTLASLVAALGCLIGSQATAGNWGNLRGKFAYDGAAPAPAAIMVQRPGCAAPLVDESLLVDPNGGLANVVVYVRSTYVTSHPRYAEDAQAEVVLDNANCQFTPRILTMRSTQTLVIKNSNQGIAISANITPAGDVGINALIASMRQAQLRFRRQQNLPQPVTSNIQSWMIAYVLPRDNPYVAVSKADGTFEIKDLPLGKLEFQVWHERCGVMETSRWPRGRFELEIKPGNYDLGTVRLSPTMFEK